MKKTLIALALTALPVAAMADVVLYGQIKGGVGVTGGANVTSTEWDKNTVNGGSTTAHYKSQDKSGTITQMEDYGSRIGFKGEEDLGNGLKAIWQVEQYVSLAGGSDRTISVITILESNAYATFNLTVQNHVSHSCNRQSS